MVNSIKDVLYTRKLNSPQATHLGEDGNLQHLIISKAKATHMISLIFAWWRDIRQIMEGKYKYASWSADGSMCIWSCISYTQS